MPLASKQPSSKREADVNESVSASNPAADRESATIVASSKRPRNSIARQACETCRAKKLRCDEEYPCSLCRSLGVECQYTERKLTTTESTLDTIVQILKRIEFKVDKQARTGRGSLSGSTTLFDASPGPLLPNPLPSPATAQPAAISLRSPGDQFGGLKLTPCTSNGDESAVTTTTTTVTTTIATAATDSVQVVFSVHQTLFWPLTLTSLPPNVSQMLQELKPYYWLAKESDRPSLSPIISASPSQAGPNWLSHLPLSIITNLSQAYFMVFNLIFPIMDEESFSVTLKRAKDGGFDLDVDTCLVMMVLSLGCLAINAYREGEYSDFLNSHGLLDPEIPTDPASDRAILFKVINEDPPGMSFFNEGRRRAGFFICESSMLSSQYNLLASLYFSQILRPVDAWTMTNRACVLLQLFWNGHAKILDGQFPDLWARLYWVAIMFEAVMGDELNLPPTDLSRFENKVPIPRFNDGPSSGQLTISPGSPVKSYFKYHFLAQVANRIIMSRIRDSLFANSTTGAHPNPRLISELEYQVEQWKENLPVELQFDENNFFVPKTSPAHAIAFSWLFARYFLSKYHMRRPYLFKALHRPDLLEAEDLLACSEAFLLALKWWRAIRASTELGIASALPYKFGICSQLLGQLTFGYIFLNSPDPRLRNCVPDGWAEYPTAALSFIATCAPHSPAAATDLELLVAMYTSLKGPSQHSASASSRR